MEDKPFVQFKYKAPEEPVVAVQFTSTNEAINIWEFHDFCKRFAAAVGYSESRIEEVFEKSII